MLTLYECLLHESRPYSIYVVSGSLPPLTVSILVMQDCVRGENEESTENSLKKINERISNWVMPSFRDPILFLLKNLVE